MGACPRHDALCRADQRPCLFRGTAEVPPRRQGKRPGKQPPAHLAKRIETYFDPLPFYHETLEVGTGGYTGIPAECADPAADGDVPLVGQPERLVAPDPHAQLPVCQPKLGASQGFEDGDWVWVESPHGKVRCMARFSRIGRTGARCGRGMRSARRPVPGACRRNANESQKGFLLNHIIAEELPPARPVPTCRTRTR